MSVRLPWRTVRPALRGPRLGGVYRGRFMSRSMNRFEVPLRILAVVVLAHPADEVDWAFVGSGLQHKNRAHPPSGQRSPRRPTHVPAPLESISPSSGGAPSRATHFCAR